MQLDRNASPFAQLQGQKRAKMLLGRSLASGRIAHAYLFKGPAGVGKKLFAAAMARAINCRVAGPATSCGTCSSCKKIISGNHPDYFVESPDKGAIKIDRVRELCKSLYYPPYESSKRVVVMEDIHAMRAEAGNCLLKTLEEPPEDNVLILTAETSKSILPTISSRCQTVPFFPLNKEETVAVLTSEKHGLDRETSEILARLSEGSPGQALLLHKEDVVIMWKKITKTLSDSTEGDDSKISELLRLAQEMADMKENLLQMFGLIRLWLRDLLVQCHDSRDHAEMSKNDSKNLLFKAGPEAIFARMKEVDRAEDQLGKNCNRSLVCEILLFRLQL